VSEIFIDIWSPQIRSLSYPLKSTSAQIQSTAPRAQYSSSLGSTSERTFHPAIQCSHHYWNWLHQQSEDIYQGMCVYLITYKPILRVLSSPSYAVRTRERIPHVL
jgi:hypothetical protein